MKISKKSKLYILVSKIASTSFVAIFSCTLLHNINRITSINVETQVIEAIEGAVDPNDGGTGPLNVDSATSGTLTKCNFNSATEVAPDNNAFQECLGQVFQFIVVIAIILILFRISLSALKAYNPAENGIDSIEESKKFIFEIALGLFFIGGPYLILTTINPALANFRLVDFTGVLSNIGSNGGSGVGNEGTNGNGVGGTSGSSASYTLSSGGANGDVNNKTVENTLKVLNDPNAEIMKTDGKTPMSNEEKQAMVQTNTAFVNDLYLKCNRNLIPASNANECKKWLNAPTAVVSNMQSIDQKSASQINSLAQNSSYTIKANDFNDVFVNNDLTLVPWSNDATNPYGKISTAIDDGGQGSNCNYYLFRVKFVSPQTTNLDKNIESDTWRTSICADTTKNQFFEKQGNDWKLKTTKYAKGTTIQDIFKR